MDQCTHEVRAEYWKNIITQCQSRPAGQTASQWLKENEIVEQTYYRSEIYTICKGYIFQVCRMQETYGTKNYNFIQGNCVSWRESEVINMLNVLFSTKMEANTKMEALEREFHLPVTPKFKEEVEQIADEVELSIEKVEEYIQMINAATTVKN